MVEPIKSGRTTRANAAGGLVDQAKAAGVQAASDGAGVAADIKDRAASLTGAASDRLQNAAGDSMNKAAAGLEELATTVHRAGEQFEGHQDMIAKLIERGADELGGLARTLRSNDLNGVTLQLQTLSKRQPALFVGLAVIAGFAAVRFGKVATSGATSSGLPHFPEANHGR